MHSNRVEWNVPFLTVAHLPSPLISAWDLPRGKFVSMQREFKKVVVPCVIITRHV